MPVLTFDAKLGLWLLGGIVLGVGLSVRELERLSSGFPVLLPLLVAQIVVTTGCVIVLADLIVQVSDDGGDGDESSTPSPAELESLWRRR